VYTPKYLIRDRNHKKNKIAPQKRKKKKKKKKKKNTKYTRSLVLTKEKIFRRTPLHTPGFIVRRLENRHHRLSSLCRTPTRRPIIAPTAAASPKLKAKGASGFPEQAPQQRCIIEIPRSRRTRGVVVWRELWR
jgi:hypothetical protein